MTGSNSNTAVTSATTPAQVPEANPETKSVVSQPPGYVGNLNAEQSKHLNDLKSMLETKSIDSDDRECLRFLRTTHFDVQKAFDMIVEYKDWYTKNAIGSMREPPRTDLLIKLVPSAFHGFDKSGHPIYIERPGAINCDLLMNQFTDNEIYMAHVFGQEKQIARCKEGDARMGHPEGTIESFTTIMDLKGLSLAHRAVLKFTQLITAADLKYYPERMHKTIIVNAPGIFSFFWRLVQGWLDPATREKVMVCSDDYHELFELIDRDQVPTRYGGTAEVAGLEDPNIEELYKVLTVDPRKPEEYTTQKLKSGVSYSVNIEMGVHETYKWVFRAEDALGFDAEFTPAPTDGVQDPNRVVTAYSTVQAHKIPNHGIFFTERPGTLKLKWKNENWFSTLRLFYIIEKDIDTTGLMEVLQSDAAAASEAQTTAAVPTSPAEELNVVESPLSEESAPSPLPSPSSPEVTEGIRDVDCKLAAFAPMPQLSQTTVANNS